MANRTGLYARVSTADRSQDPENQISLLRQYCESGKFKIYKQYGDHGSGRKGDGTEYLVLLDAVGKRKHDVGVARKCDFIDHWIKMVVNALDKSRGLGTGTSHPVLRPAGYNESALRSRSVQDQNRKPVACGLRPGLQRYQMEQKNKES